MEDIDFEIVYHVNKLVIEPFVRSYTTRDVNGKNTITFTRENTQGILIFSLKEKLSLSPESKKYELTEKHPYYKNIKDKTNITDETILIVDSNGGEINLLVPLNNIDRWLYRVNPKLEQFTGFIEDVLIVDSVIEERMYNDSNTIYITVMDELHTDESGDCRSISVMGSWKPDTDEYPRTIVCEGWNNNLSEIELQPLPSISPPTHVQPPIIQPTNPTEPPSLPPPISSTTQCNSFWKRCIDFFKSIYRYIANKISMLFHKQVDKKKFDTDDTIP